MSLIAGIFRRDGAPVSLGLDSMLAATASFPNDGSTRLETGPIALGHQLLETGTAASDAAQPLTVGPLTIVADARIDNREAVTAALAGRSTDPGDPALILAAYQAWGEECCSRLLGDFAFAIWDAKARRLFCARDHFGVRPLHYFASGRLFAFASEVRALLSLEEVPRKVNELYLGANLVPVYEDTRLTFFEGIYRLPPGHSMSITADQSSERRYWSLDRETRVQLPSTADYAARYLELFTEAVRARVPDAGRLAATLSGGLDSSAVACMTRTVTAGAGRGPVHTFSGRYDQAPESDEGEFIEAVTELGGFESHFVYPDTLSPLGDWRGEGYGPNDEPAMNPQLALHWLLIREASASQARVLLDGLGGDGTVSYGFGYLAELLRRARLLRLIRESRALERHHGFPARSWIWRSAVVPSVPAAMARVARRALRRPGAGWSRGAAIREDFARRVQLEDYVREQQVLPETPLRDAGEENWIGLVTGLNAYSLGNQAHVTALLGVEARYPFFDPRLAQFCLGLPGEQRLAEGFSRLIARRALADVLPDKIRWRRGKGMLNHSFNRGLKVHDAGAVASLLSSRGPIAEYVDMAALEVVYQRFLAQGANQDSYQLFRVAMIARWLESDAKEPVPVSADHGARAR